MDAGKIVLVVDEPIAGHFYWVLQQQDGGDCRPIEAADGPMPSYATAMMAGIAALQRRADTRAPGEAPPVVTAFVDPRQGLGPSTVH